ncbi:hypothetical protein EON68_00160 [archaeon]|nr:MAG: hypothetical protein EON68_00160 [archaeon]
MQEPGGMHIALVLTRRPSASPPLPDLNKWQHRQCADCGVTQVCPPARARILHAQLCTATCACAATCACTATCA